LRQQEQQREGDDLSTRKAGQGRVGHGDTMVEER